MQGWSSFSGGAAEWSNMNASKCHDGLKSAFSESFLLLENQIRE
jgi:hypothetical protein